MKRLLSFLKLMAFASLLAACTGETEPAPVIPAPEPATETTTAVDETVVEPEPITADLTLVQGATPAEVLAYVGEPSLVRRDDTVQVMSFETEHCVFEVIFYEPSPTDHFEARYINARDRSGRALDAEACLTDILNVSPSP